MKLISASIKPFKLDDVRAALSELGVTWVQVGAPGDDIERTLQAYARYGEDVIANLR